MAEQTLTWGDLDDMVEGDPLQLRDRAWAEIQRLTAKLASSRAVRAVREDELLRLKGPCSTSTCRLHYAHSGPCDIREVTPDA